MTAVRRVREVEERAGGEGKGKVSVGIDFEREERRQRDGARERGNETWSRVTKERAAVKDIGKQAAERSTARGGEKLAAQVSAGAATAAQPVEPVRNERESRECEHVAVGTGNRLGSGQRECLVPP